MKSGCPHKGHNPIVLGYVAGVVSVVLCKVLYDKMKVVVIQQTEDGTST